MASLKSGEVDRFLSRPDFNRNVFLIYGPDTGLVSERADVLAKNSGVDLSDPFCLIRLDADDAAVDGTRIASEAHTVGMFGGKRLIRISGTTRRDLAKAVQPVLDTPAEDAIIIIEAGDLKKSSGLRKNLEKHAASLCIPCYQDNDSAIETLIDQEITGAGLNIDAEIRRVLRGLLGADRRISRGELSKLALYCDGCESVTLEDVKAMIGDASKLVLDDLVDAVAIGELVELEIGLAKAFEAGSSPDMIILAALRHFQLLQSSRTRLEVKRENAGSIIGSFRPPLHFSRKQAVTTAISIWPLVRISKALSRLDTAMLECRSTAGISNALARTALLALALEARSLRKRR